MRWHAPTPAVCMIMCTQDLWGPVEQVQRQVGEKRLLVELQALREAQKEKRMEIEWCSSEQQLADALTKSMVV